MPYPQPVWESARVMLVGLGVAALALLGTAGCSSAVAPSSASLRARAARIRPAIDAQIEAQHAVADEATRGLTLERLQSASARLGAAEMLAYGGGIMRDPAARRCAARELTRLEREFETSDR